MLAVCCHHQCNWEDYVGQKWWLSLGLTRSDFGVFVKASSWASIAVDTDTRPRLRAAGTRTVTDSPSERSARSARSESAAKRAKGVQCKRFIDAGRVAFLREEGVGDAHLQTYCDSAVTVENCLLVVRF